MNYSTYRFTLDIHKNKSQVSVPVLFGDTGIQFYISMTDGGKPYFIEDGCRAVFSAKKPDGSVLFNDCIIEDNTRILYQFTTQTTNVEGLMNCEIRLYGTDGNLITTPCFVVVVDPRVVYDSDLDDSKPEATAIDSMMRAEVARSEAEADRIAAEANRVEAEAGRVAAETERETKVNNAVDQANRASIAVIEAIGSYVTDIGSIIGDVTISFTVSTSFHGDLTYTAIVGTTWKEFNRSAEAIENGSYWINGDGLILYQHYRIMLGNSEVKADDKISNGAIYTLNEAVTQEAMTAWNMRRG